MGWAITVQFSSVYFGNQSTTYKQNVSGLAQKQRLNYRASPKENKNGKLTKDSSHRLRYHHKTEWEGDAKFELLEGDASPFLCWNPHQLSISNILCSVIIQINALTGHKQL